MNTNDFRTMYEKALVVVGEGAEDRYRKYNEIRSFGTEEIGQDAATGRAWTTYIDIRQGAGFMGQPQIHETAAQEVAKSHKSF